jgi:uncharacterized protein YjbJ (UPF0337 family)
MDKNRVAGSAKQAKGTLKEAVGKATGSRRLQDKGAADRADGRVRSATGRVKDSVKQKAH